MSQPDTNRFQFPPVEMASPEGLLAIGGDLSSERLIEAYRQGIFPWYNEDQPILWWSPDPRLVLFPQRLKISRSLKKLLRKNLFQITFDTAFREVMLGCAAPRSPSMESDTWISNDMITAYMRLHTQGLAHSVETWQSGKLVGGLYGVALGGCYFGESMFSRVADASKAALVYLVNNIINWGFDLIDCQVSSDHLISLGAEEIHRVDFMCYLESALKRPGKPGSWSTDAITDGSKNFT